MAFCFCYISVQRYTGPKPGTELLNLSQKNCVQNLKKKTQQKVLAMLIAPHVPLRSGYVCFLLRLISAIPLYAEPKSKNQMHSIWF